MNIVSGAYLFIYVSVIEYSPKIPWWGSVKALNDTVLQAQVFYASYQSTHYVLCAGLFEYSHMEFNAERGAAADAEEGATAGTAVKADDPSLADMTRAALSILLKNDKGFFLLIEGQFCVYCKSIAYDNSLLMYFISNLAISLIYRLIYCFIKYFYVAEKIERSNPLLLT